MGVHRGTDSTRSSEEDGEKTPEPMFPLRRSSNPSEECGGRKGEKIPPFSCLAPLRLFLCPYSAPRRQISMDVLVAADSEMKRKQKMEVHYVNAGAPYVIEENYEGYIHDNSVEMLAAFLQSQETAYQSFQRARETDVAKASSSNPSSGHDHGQSGGSTSMGSPFQSMGFEEQFAVDEAIARELQYVEDNLAATSLSAIAITAAGDEGIHPVLQETSVTPPDHVAAFTDISDLPIAQDGIDPDNMTYEELQSLGEAIGTESRGLSDKLISSLKTSTYRTGFFSRKDKNEECVICCMPYKNGEMLVTLPCKHYYHSHCAKRWLKINKVCPVCNKEVFGS